jgi:hypothetical protein
MSCANILKACLLTILNLRTVDCFVATVLKFGTIDLFKLQEETSWNHNKKLVPY